MLQKTNPATLAELESEHAPSHSVFGFWLYLMTDCVLFASLFAVFAVMAHQFAGGPSGKDLFDIPGVALETAVLLLSSITYGFAMLGARQRKSGVVLGWLAVTFVLGLAVLTASGVFLYRKYGRRKVEAKPAAAPAAPPKPEDVVALAALQELESKGLYRKPAYKAQYFGLSQILKR